MSSCISLKTFEKLFNFEFGYNGRDYKSTFIGYTN